ncbi:hypothetical protein COU60_02910 [Candidatus Pacearchaeota archaeon CG10_big_fil_rev_8_21_14_0_10_34_76]|nr:MAG: hypothetical protein COU60_02910 [Candidatus Pacearchaeota archaeon CG10_big_fil_rev_8_21_14_0_10_34_76]
MINTKLFIIVFVGLLVVAFTGNVSAARDSKIDSGVLSDFENEKIVKVIVNVRDDFGRIPSDSLVINDVMKKFNNKRVGDVFGNDAFVIELSKSEVLSLAKNGNVYYIEGIISFIPMLQDSVEIVDAVGAWDKQVGGVNLDGYEQTICVVDTGVDFNHPDLADKNILGAVLDCTQSGGCFLNNTTGDGSITGHGTSVAGVVAASGGINGIGKGSNIIAAKVFADGSSNAGIEAIERAVEWCVDNAEGYDISVISMSLGTSNTYQGTCDGFAPSFDQRVNNALAKNVSIVVASGNNGNSSEITYPACVSTTIPVAATNKDDSVWSGSNYNGLVKLFAPGSDINLTKKDGGYRVTSGTSASAPMVSAAIAIINQYLALTGNPMSMHPKYGLEQLLYEQGLQFSVNGYEFSRINVNKPLLVLDSIAPLVELVSPEDESWVYGRNPEIEFTCSATDWQLDNLAIEVKKNGNTVYASTRAVAGDFAEETFNVILGSGDYTWNCYSDDLNGNIGSAPEDYNLSIRMFTGNGGASNIIPINITRWP